MALKCKMILRKDMRKDAQAGAKLLYGATVVTAQYWFDQLCKDITDNRENGGMWQNPFTRLRMVKQGITFSSMKEQFVKQLSAAAREAY